MKCQCLFAGNIKKNIISLSSAEFACRAAMVNFVFFFRLVSSVVETS